MQFRICGVPPVENKSSHKMIFTVLNAVNTVDGLYVQIAVS